MVFNITVLVCNLMYSSHDITFKYHFPPLKRFLFQLEPENYDH